MAETSSWAITHPNYLLRAGVIDPDYQGEVTAHITYLGPEEGHIQKGERVAQVIPECFRDAPFQLQNADHGRGIGATDDHTREGSGRGTSAGFEEQLSRSMEEMCKRSFEEEDSDDQ